MKNDELESILRKAQVPEISEESLEMFPRQVVADLKRDVAPRRPLRYLLPSLAWSFGLAVCVVAVLVMVRWHGPKETSPAQSPDVLASAKLVHEMLAMFPNRVRAITEDANGLHLLLSDDDNARSSAPLYVHICDGKNCSSLVTFSGEEIKVNGQALTVLCEADGGIILEGNKFVWSSGKGLDAAPSYKIEARNLGRAAM
jgi:hypothetical protein